VSFALEMKSNIKAIVFFFATFALVEVANLLTHRQFNQFGLVPRSVDHLGGIFLSPWLHGYLQHFVANFSAILFLGCATWLWGNRVFWKTTLFIVVISGLLVWLLGRPAYHIGASGLVYGYFGFCVIAGWFSRRFGLMLISVLIAAFYGSMIWGVLPIQAGTSFEYHLAGFLCGLVAAKLWASNKNP
jgi:membrane associated rhomboid family serine protease